MSRNAVGTYLGRKGMGKTTLVREVLAERSRVVVLDALGEYGARDRLLERWGFDDSLAALERAASSEEFRLSLRCHRTEDALDLLEVCFELERYLLVLEEASLLCRPSELPDAVGRLIRYGRHREIDLAFVARRPSELHRDVTAQSDYVVSFQQTEPRDLAYFSALAGPDAEGLARLEPRHFLVFGDLGSVPAPVLRRMAAPEIDLTSEIPGC